MSADPLTDVLGCLQANPRDSHAWSELYDVLWRWVFATMVQHYRDPAAAEDAAQEVMVRIARNAVFTKATSPGSFRSYVRRLCSSVVVDLFRQRNSQMHATGSAHRVEMDQLAEVLVDPRPSSEDLQIIRSVTTRALETLSTEEQQLVRLLAEGCSPNEISVLRNVDSAQVYRDIYRLRSRVKRALEHT